jgi:hypothetical protein
VERPALDRRWDIPATRIGPGSLVPVKWLHEAAGLETSDAVH